MTAQNVLRIPERSVATLQDLAAQVSVSCEAYTEQSLRLGIYLAALVAEAEDDSKVSVLFQRSGRSYDVYPITFGQKPEPIGNHDFEFQDSQWQTDQLPLLLEINPVLYRTAEKIAGLFNASFSNFAETSYFFRWQWAVARQQHAEILIDDGAPTGDYLLVEEDIFLDLGRYPY